MMPETDQRPAGPYAAAAYTYWSAGWRGIVPLPPRAKKNPPSGFTGSTGIDPSYADITAWATDREGAGNIALRLPRGVIGLDVDAYGDKLGRATIEQAEADHGQLPPTWRTTSRDDGVSGIRLYRVPEGLAWPGEIGMGTEVIQHRHRYAIVWPSTHPEGRTYRWIGPDGVVSTTVPDVDELPYLPDAWVQAYTGGEVATTLARGNHTDMAIARWLTELDHADDPMCTRMEGAVDQMTRALPGSAHNAARDMALRCIRLAEEGHHGLMAALATGRRMFVADATSDDRRILGKHQRTEAEAAKEWADVIVSAGNLVTANPSGVRTCDCYGQITGLIVDTPPPATEDRAEDTAPAATSTETDADPEERHSRLKDGAAFILDVPAAVPAIWGHDDEVYWATGEALMIVGPPGVGKTTLTGQLLRGLVGLQPAVLGMGVTPSDGRVLYLAMDRPAQIARALRRGFHEHERDVLAERVRVWEGPPPADVAKHTDLLVNLAHLAGATTIIVDSLKDAAVGLTEDEVGAGYNRARQKALANGIQVLELHHLVKRGPNGSRPNTLADVYGSAWLTAGAGSVLLLWGQAGDPVVEASHLKQPAGEVGPFNLVHDHTTGTTTIASGKDVVEIVANGWVTGASAKDVAKVLFETSDPSRSEIEKARRRLDAACRGEAPLLRFDGGEKGGDGGTKAGRYHLVEGSADQSRDQSRPITSTGYPQPPSVIGVHDPVIGLTSDDAENVIGRDRPCQSNHARPPLYRGTGVHGAPPEGYKRAVVAGQQVWVHPTTGELWEPDA